MSFFSNGVPANGKMLLLGRDWDVTVFYERWGGHEDPIELVFIQLNGIYQDDDYLSGAFASLNHSIDIDPCEISERERDAALEIAEIADRSMRDDL